MEPGRSRAAARLHRDRHHRHRRPEHARAWPEAADLLGSGLPPNELAARSSARHARLPREAKGEFAVVFAAMGITHDERRPSSAAVRGDAARSSARPLPQPRGRPGRRAAAHAALALTVAEYLAFEKDMQVLVGPHGHDQLLRGAARGLDRARERSRVAGATRATCTPTSRPSTSAPAASRAARARSRSCRSSRCPTTTSRTRSPTSPATSPRARSCSRASSTAAASTRRSTCCRACRAS